MGLGPGRYHEQPLSKATPEKRAAATGQGDTNRTSTRLHASTKVAKHFVLFSARGTDFLFTSTMMVWRRVPCFVGLLMLSGSGLPAVSGDTPSYYPLRTFDGTGNNEGNPMWGSIGSTQVCSTQAQSVGATSAVNCSRALLYLGVGTNKKVCTVAYTFQHASVIEDMCTLKTFSPLIGWPRSRKRTRLC